MSNGWVTPGPTQSHSSVPSFPPTKQTHTHRHAHRWLRRLRVVQHRVADEVEERVVVLLDDLKSLGSLLLLDHRNVGKVLGDVLLLVANLFLQHLAELGVGGRSGRAHRPGASTAKQRRRTSGKRPTEGRGCLGEQSRACEAEHCGGWYGGGEGGRGEIGGGGGVASSLVNFEL